MLRIVFKNTVFYSIESLARIRRLSSLKVCYRPELEFLKLRITLSRSISNRLVYRSNYLRSYKNIRNYYVSLLRGNFTEKLNPVYQAYTDIRVDSRKFMSAYSKTKLMKELDYAMMWRGVQTNSLFNVAFKVTKKRKKYTFKQRVLFINPKRRLLFV